MKPNSFVRVTLVACAAIALSACSGSNAFNVGGNDLCSEDYNLFPPLQPNQTEFSLDTTSVSRLPPGQYNYDGGAIYYHNTTTGLQIRIDDVQQADDSWSPAVGCMRNMTPDTTGITVTAQSIHDLRVNDDYSTLMNVNQYGFTISTDSIATNFTQIQNKVSTSLTGAFTDTAVFIKTSPDTADSFEIHVSGTTSDGTYQLLVHLARVDLSLPNIFTSSTVAPGLTPPAPNAKTYRP